MLGKEEIEWNPRPPSPGAGLQEFSFTSRRCRSLDSSIEKRSTAFSKLLMDFFFGLLDLFEQLCQLGLGRRRWLFYSPPTVDIWLSLTSRSFFLIFSQLAFPGPASDYTLPTRASRFVPNRRICFAFVSSIFEFRFIRSVQAGPTLLFFAHFFRLAENAGFLSFPAQTVISLFFYSRMADYRL